MVLFNYTSKELTAKIVYYGPGLCGKTTNLQFIYDNLPAHVKKGKMLSLATKTDRTLFFDFLPIELGKIRGMKTRVQLYTVPGQVFYNSTRKLVLKGADGLVFVADSQQKMMESNAESYRNLEENLKEIGLKLEDTPLVMQFNKRDLPHLASVEEMNTLINRHNAPFYEAVATTGIGVEDTLKAITKLVLNHLSAKYNLGVAPEARSAAAAEVPAPPPAAAAAQSAGKGVTVATDPGDMEIERIGRAGAARPLMSDSGSDLDLEDDLEQGTDAPIFGEEPSHGAEEPAGMMRAGPTMEDDLEIVDLGDVALPDSLPEPDRGELFPGREEGPEDLSDLLEELPADAADESDPTPEEPLPDFSRPSILAPSPPRGRPSQRIAPATPLRRVPEMPAVPTAREVVSSGTRSRGISPSDPLGIGEGKRSEAPVARAIQVGAVQPGREHEITVPLEMSVEGRKVRLNLKMTLTLSR
jgi:mutual gliding-motility protein MglA